MKIPIGEAAARLRLHPCELVLELARMTGSFEELCPEVDEGFVQTLLQMHPERLAPTADRATAPGVRDSDAPNRISLRLSKDAARIVEVLCHKGHWGRNSVSPDTLRNHYCRGLEDFDAAVKELVRADILTARHPHGPFSLNPKAKSSVEAIIAASPDPA